MNSCWIFRRSRQKKITRKNYMKELQESTTGKHYRKELQERTTGKRCGGEYSRSVSHQPGHYYPRDGCKTGTDRGRNQLPPGQASRTKPACACGRKEVWSLGS